MNNMSGINAVPTLDSSPIQNAQTKLDNALVELRDEIQELRAKINTVIPSGGIYSVFTEAESIPEPPKSSMLMWFENSINIVNDLISTVS